MENTSPPAIVDLSSKKFLAGAALAALALVWAGRNTPLPPGLLAAEVFLTILALFIFGSIRYRLDKNALTYGAALVIGATFSGFWLKASNLPQALRAEGPSALWPFLHRHFLTLEGLDKLVHADTMLFILGLTFFVAVIAQTRLLETVSFRILDRTGGRIFPTLAVIIAIVSFASGILDGVSMIGLMIRTLVIILFLAKARDEAVLYAVMVSTVVTTVCGIWLAYGEPPNLIMKANLHPHLDNAFFLRYCLPAAVGSYFIVIWNVRKKLGETAIDLSRLDILDRHTADVSFLQASRHGEVLIPVEFVDGYRGKLGERFAPVVKRLHLGEPLGSALIKEGTPDALRKEMLGHFLSEDLADTLDGHYAAAVRGDAQEAERLEAGIRRSFETVSGSRLRAQKVGTLAFVPFVGCLVWHALDHSVPLFWASFAGFFVALAGIWTIAPMRQLALREAKHEYMEYLFLFPLFFAITLLQKTGFFDQMSVLLHHGIERLGASLIAGLQFTGAAFLSALLDNNVVADFASRTLHSLDLGLLHLFAMAQIAGYATGGCWTHIGCAQSVVAYAFIRKEIDEHYTPFAWIKAMTPAIIEIFILMGCIIYGESLLLSFLK